MGTTRSMTSRFPNGIATNEIQQNLGQYILPDITSAHTFFDDFDNLPTGTSTGWNITETQGGATQALGNEDGGTVILTNSAADDDVNQIQRVNESFLFETGKQLWFKSRFKVDDATQSELAVGLQITNADGTGAVTDGVFFRKSDADLTLQLVVVKDSTETVTDVLEMADDTYVTVGYYYDGFDKITIYSGNEDTGKSVTTNLPDDEELSPIIVIKNGEAVIKVLRDDYILASKER